jgi:methionine-rich copper-binding protein CopC
MRISVRQVALMGVLMMATGQAAWAHEAAEHAKEAADAKASANCANMQTMDMSAMKANDPVMQAMMSKCAKKADKADSKSTAMDPDHMQSMPMTMDNSKMKMPAKAHSGY